MAWFLLSLAYLEFTAKRQRLKVAKNGEHNVQDRSDQRMLINAQRQPRRNSRAKFSAAIEISGRDFFERQD
jgi:hypothetical protein